jgi:mono/diheme cytochrome c family protein
MKRLRTDNGAGVRNMTKHASKWVMVASVTVGLSAVALAQDLDAGKSEFQSSCATCHGTDGKANGPLSEQLRVAPADLTVLAKNNNGVFPVNAVYETIYGIKRIVAHGPPDMPIWGYRYFARNTAPGSKKPDHYVELSSDLDAIARTRLFAVVDYLNRIQQK